MIKSRTSALSDTPFFPLFPSIPETNSTYILTVRQKTCHVNLPNNPAQRGRHPLLGDVIFYEQQFKYLKYPLFINLVFKYLHCRNNTVLCFVPQLFFEGSCFDLKPTINQKLLEQPKMLKPKQHS